MKIRKCIIITDYETKLNSSIQDYIKKIPFLEIIKICSDYIEAMQILGEEKISLIFLEINNADNPGFILLKTFPNLPPAIAIAHSDEFAVQCYELGNVCDYLVKPFLFERFLLAVNRSLTLRIAGSAGIQEEDFIFLKAGRKTQKFIPSSIDFVEAYGIYSKIWSNGQMSLVNQSILYLSEALNNDIHIRVHKSYIVNISRITSFNHQFIWLGQTKIPIGVSFRTRIKGILPHFNKSDMRLEDDIENLIP